MSFMKALGDKDNRQKNDGAKYYIQFLILSLHRLMDKGLTWHKQAMVKNRHEMWVRIRVGQLLPYKLKNLCRTLCVYMKLKICKYTDSTQLSYKGSIMF